MEEITSERKGPAKGDSALAAALVLVGSPRLLLFCVVSLVVLLLASILAGAVPSLASLAGALAPSRSWWCRGLLLVLAANTLVCPVIRRGILSVRSSEASPARLEGISENVVAQLERAGYGSLRLHTTSSRTFLQASRGTIHRRAFVAMHAAAACMIAALALSSSLGTSFVVTVGAGETFTVPGTGRSVTVAAISTDSSSNAMTAQLRWQEPGQSVSSQAESRQSVQSGTWRATVLEARQLVLARSTSTGETTSLTELGPGDAIEFGQLRVLLKSITPGSAPGTASATFEESGGTAAQTVVNIGGSLEQDGWRIDLLGYREEADLRLSSSPMSPLIAVAGVCFLAALFITLFTPVLRLAMAIDASGSIAEMRVTDQTGSYRPRETEALRSSLEQNA